MQRQGCLYFGNGAGNDENHYLFFELLLAKEALATAIKQTNSDRLYKVAIAKRKMGQISGKRLVATQTELYKAKPDVTEAESTLNKMFQLRSFLGVSESEGLNPVIPGFRSSIKMDYDRVLNKALERNSFARIYVAAS